MDAVANMRETEIKEILGPTISAFVPLLEPLRTEIESARKTFRYGDTDRHQLDVYYPPAATDGAKHPVLFFVYGGGFVNGARTFPAPTDLGYGNVGLYFAKQGFVTVIPDYRLAPATTFPGPAEDVRAALAWAVAHPADLGDSADLERVFLMGHSAGGVHAFTVPYHPPSRTPVPGLPLRGVVLVSVPFHFDFPGMGSTGDVYYGSPGGTAAHSPLALLKAAPEFVPPPLALVQGERDPPGFFVVAKDFNGALAEQGIVPTQIAAKGHNHISLTWALGTGQGEAWAEEVAKWMQGL